MSLLLQIFPLELLFLMLDHVCCYASLRAFGGVSRAAKALVDMFIAHVLMMRYLNDPVLVHIDSTTAWDVPFRFSVAQNQLVPLNDFHFIGATLFAKPYQIYALESSVVSPYHKTVFNLIRNKPQCLIDERLNIAIRHHFGFGSTLAGATAHIALSPLGLLQQSTSSIDTIYGIAFDSTTSLCIVERDAFEAKWLAQINIGRIPTANTFELCIVSETAESHYMLPDQFALIRVHTFTCSRAHANAPWEFSQTQQNKVTFLTVTETTVVEEAPGLMRFAQQTLVHRPTVHFLAKSARSIWWWVDADHYGCSLLVTTPVSEASIVTHIELPSVDSTASIDTSSSTTKATVRQLLHTTYTHPRSGEQKSTFATILIYNHYISDNTIAMVFSGNVACKSTAVLWFVVIDLATDHLVYCAPYWLRTTMRDPWSVKVVRVWQARNCSGERVILAALWSRKEARLRILNLSLTRVNNRPTLLYEQQCTLPTGFA